MSKSKKIFCVGFNKTGTTTLHAIFKEQLEIDSAHRPKWTYWSIDENDPRILAQDAFSDGETADLDALIKNYPDAYFILNTRPLKNWLASRHKAIERSKASVKWMFSKFFPARFISNFVCARILRNDDQSITRWIQIRNSYHRYALSLAESKSNFILLNIEDQDMLNQLQSFLSLETQLHPVVRNADGHNSITAKILDAIGEKKSNVDSAAAIDFFLKEKGIIDHKNCLTYFEDEEFLLTKNNADKICTIFPFMKWVFRKLYLYSVRKRGKMKSYVSKTFFDALIKWFRSEKDLKYFTSVNRFGSGSR